MPEMNYRCPPPVAPAADVAFALVLVMEDSILRRLVASWPMVQPRVGEGEHWGDVWVRWGEMSGVGVSVVQQRLAVLFASGVCDQNGTVAPLAKAVLVERAAAAAKVQKKGPPARGPREG